MPKSCSLLVHDLITVSSWLVHNLLTSWSQLVNKFFMTCSWLALDLSMTCSQFDLYLFMTSSMLFVLLPWFVHYSFMTCLQLFRTSSRIVVKIVSDCLWLVHDLLLALDLFSTCSWHIYELFIIFHDSSMACSQLVLKFQHNLLLCLTLSASFDVRNGYLYMKDTSCHLQDTSPSLPWCLGWCHG